MHFGQVLLSSVNEKGKTLNLKRYLLPTHHGAFPKYRKAFLAEFAYRFNRRSWPNQAFDRLLYACIDSDPVPLPVLRA